MSIQGGRSIADSDMLRTEHWQCSLGYGGRQASTWKIDERYERHQATEEFTTALRAVTTLNVYYMEIRMTFVLFIGLGLLNCHEVGPLHCVGMVETPVKA